MEHTLVEVDGLLRCSACLQRFTGQPTGKLALCLGAPTFQWDAWPEGLKAYLDMVTDVMNRAKGDAEKAKELLGNGGADRRIR